MLYHSSKKKNKEEKIKCIDKSVVKQTAMCTLALTELHQWPCGGPSFVHIRSFWYSLCKLNNAAACCRDVRREEKEGMSALLRYSRCCGNGGLKYQ